MTLNASLRRHDQAGETSTELWTIPVVRGKRQLLLSREACVLLKPVTSKLSWFYGLNSSNDSEGEVGIEIIGFG